MKDNFKILLDKLKIIESYPEEKKQKAYKMLSDSDELRGLVLLLLQAVKERDVAYFTRILRKIRNLVQ